jgi:phage tail sheath protein FI
MPFQLSPGVNVSEFDLTNIVPAVATSTGAIAGVFETGPVNERVLIDSESKLVSIFGKPTADNYETWFTAANFLSYGNSLYVVRVASSNSTTAYGNTGSVATAPLVRNEADYQADHGTYDADIMYLSKYPGISGNSLRVSVCDSVAAYQSNLYMDSNDAAGAAANVEVNFAFTIGSNSATLTATPGTGSNAAAANTYASNLIANLAVSDVLSIGNSSIGKQYLKITAISSVTAGVASISFSEAYRLSTNFSSNASLNNTIIRQWEFASVVGNAPTTTDYVAQFGNSSAVDEVHVVVVDEKGTFSGRAGTILETFAGLSRATNATTTGGAVNYYKDVINQSSKYVWWNADRANAVSNTAVDILSSTNKSVMNLQFSGGTEGSNNYTESTIPLGIVAQGYDLFASAEDIDVSLILQGKPIGGAGADYQLANYIIDNLCETRKDCVAFISPADTAVTNNIGTEAQGIVDWRNNVHDTSYAVMDSGYKYQYDKYNDVYRWVPMNGDIAGLCVRTDNTRDPWWSPAGFNRGQIKNLVKLRYNPKKADRDLLYSNGVNPVVTFPGQGTVLYGDKTLQTKPSAFDRINVRRLFIVLEKAISTAAKYFLFEFNDEFTRAQFKALVNPYLRDIQGRRGITDFLVVCDETNNTGEVIDRNEFIGDIYIKPARSINFIQLNFVAVRTGVQFSEVVGKF